MKIDQNKELCIAIFGAKYEWIKTDVPETHDLNLTTYTIGLLS
jgi:hypothetical protein